MKCLSPDSSAVPPLKCEHGFIYLFHSLLYVKHSTKTKARPPALKLLTVHQVRQMLQTHYEQDGCVIICKTVV